MAHEQEARVRAFYDHEHDEPAPGRRRRAAADWGVGEDMFDRMPTGRGTRADRRAEHREELDGPRFERRPSGPARPVAEEGQPSATTPRTSARRATTIERASRRTAATGPTSTSGARSRRAAAT